MCTLLSAQGSKSLQNNLEALSDILQNEIASSSVKDKILRTICSWSVNIVSYSVSCKYTNLRVEHVYKTFLSKCPFFSLSLISTSSNYPLSITRLVRPSWQRRPPYIPLWSEYSMPGNTTSAKRCLTFLPVLTKIINCAVVYMHVQNWFLFDYSFWRFWWRIWEML